jgi:hypothetical protein
MPVVSDMVFEIKNAHLRIGSVTFKRYSEKINASTNVTAFCDRYICDESQLHLVSFFGSDTEMAAFSAAIQDGRQLGVEFAGHSLFYRSLGTNPKCYKSQIQIPGRKRKLVHMVAISETLQMNGTQDCAYCLGDTAEPIWDTLVYLFGQFPLDALGMRAWVRVLDWILDHRDPLAEKLFATSKSSKFRDRFLLAVHCGLFLR